MRVKLTLFLFILLSVGLQAQVMVDDFENTTNVWQGVSCGFEIKDNDQKSGLNLSDKVLYIVRVLGCDNWSGAILNPYVQKGYKYVHAYMYRNNTNKPNLKVSDTNAKDLEPMTAIVANQWQDVVWDISEYENSGIEFIFFMVDRTGITEDAWMLVDQVQLSNDATPRTDVLQPTGKGDNPDDKPIINPTGEYQLVWSDEFNGTELDREMWNIEVNGNGGGNNELQYYCEKGVSVHDGCLFLTATKEEYSGKHCTSGRINTLGKVYFTHGKVEAKIRFPKTANGLWPAFWMMGNDYAQVGWPRCGETDIIEMGNVNGINKGTSDRYFNGASHYGTNWDRCEHKAQDHTAPYSLQDGEFHLITCIWTDESVSMYYDLDKDPNRAPYYTLSLTDNSHDLAAGTYFHKPNFILFNLAVGGDFTNIWDINQITALADGPRSLQVDYVRLYQKGVSGETFVGKQTNTAVERVEESNNVKVKKIMLNGTIRILRDGKIYTTTGQLIK